MFEMYVLLLHVCLCHEIMFMGPNQHTIELKGVWVTWLKFPPTSITHYNNHMHAHNNGFTVIT